MVKFLTCPCSICCLPPRATVAVGKVHLAEVWPSQGSNSRLNWNKQMFKSIQLPNRLYSPAYWPAQQACTHSRRCHRGRQTQQAPGTSSMQWRGGKLPCDCKKHNIKTKVNPNQVHLYWSSNSLVLALLKSMPGPILPEGASQETRAICEPFDFCNWECSKSSVSFSWSFIQLKNLMQTCMYYFLETKSLASTSFFHDHWGLL